MKDTTKVYLMDLLVQACDLVGKFTGGFSRGFASAEDFHETLTRSVEQLRMGDESQIRHLYLWFAPTSCWDDFTDDDGVGLGNKIFAILSDQVHPDEEQHYSY